MSLRTQPAAARPRAARGADPRGEVDTVVIAFTDMQGRLQGKRLHARYFLDVVLESGTEGCNYLLGVDVDMNTVDGYAITSWDKGYGDMEFVLDHDTIRLLPHLPATAMVQCDLVWDDHQRRSEQSPRRSSSTSSSARPTRLRRAGRHRAGVHRLRRHLRGRLVGGYRDLTPSNQYNVDYSILGTTRVEPLLRDIRNSMYAAGMNVEGAKGECNFGQHEIGFLYADAVVTADNHARLQDGRQGDRRPARQVAHVHGEVQRARGQLLPHPPVAAWGRRVDGVLGRRPSVPPLYDQLRRRRAGDDGATSRCCTRRTSTPTSGSPTARSRRRRSPGAGQPHLRRSAWWVTGRARAWRTACPAAT